MSKKILIIEDDNILQKAIKEELLYNGYEVEQAFNGEDGFKKILKFKPDLIMLDLLMPVKPGEWVLKQLDDRNIINDYKIIVFTMKSEEASINNCKRFNIKHYMIKSDYSLLQLMKRVDDLLDKK